MIAKSLFLSLLFFVSTQSFRAPLLRSLRNKVSVTKLSSTVIAPPVTTTTAAPETPAVPAKSLQQFVWKKQWYPIAVEVHTDKNKSQALHLLGNDVVLWFDTKQWRVFEDACPHRGVPLSEGRVEKNGELLCAYHAWSFDGEGQCTSIPQTKTKEKETSLKAMSKSCVKSYPTMVAQGLIWVWGEKGAPGSDVALEAAIKQPRLIEELSDPQYEGRIGTIHWNFRDIPYGWDMFMENVLDPAHVPVSHHNIIGNRYTDTTHVAHQRVPSRSEIPIADGGEFNPLYPEDKGFNHRVISKTGVNATNDFRPPCLNKITAPTPGGGLSILALYATPTMPGYCRHIGSQIVINPPPSPDGKKAKSIIGGVFALPLPAWLLHVAASFFLHQDQVFLHHQERMLYASSNYAFGRFNGRDSSNTKGQELGEFKLTSNPQAYASTYFMPNEMDAQITTFRNWIATKANGGPVWGKSALARGLPARLPPAQLFDVWDAHTKNCATCQAALKNLVTVRNSCMVLAAVAAIMMRGTVRALITTGIFSLFALAAQGLKGLFYKFEFHHQNNN